MGLWTRLGVAGIAAGAVMSASTAFADCTCGKDLDENRRIDAGAKVYKPGANSGRYEAYQSPKDACPRDYKAEAIADKDRDPQVVRAAKTSFFGGVDETLAPGEKLEPNVCVLKFDSGREESVPVWLVTKEPAPIAPPPPAAPVVEDKMPTPIAEAVIYFGVDLPRTNDPLETALTPDDKRAIAQMIGEARNRGISPENAVVEIYGATSTTASYQHNFALSGRRAEAMALFATSMGVKNVYMRGLNAEGEQCLQVPTADGVEEKLNRRALMRIYEPGAEPMISKTCRKLTETDVNGDTKVIRYESSPHPDTSFLNYQGVNPTELAAVLQHQFAQSGLGRVVVGFGPQPAPAAANEDNGPRFAVA